MFNVSFGLQSFLFTISFIIVLSADGFTIYLDGGGEFKTLGKDLVGLKEDVKELRESAIKKLDSIERKMNELTTLMNSLSKDLQTMKDSARGSGKACTVKMRNERNLKL